MNEQRQQELMRQLADIAEELGWYIGLPVTLDDKVPGIFIGTEEFISEVANLYSDDLDVLEKQPTAGKKGTQFH